MKKIIFAALILISSNFLLFSQVSGDAQIIKSEHWVYQDLLTLSSELRIGNFSTNTPITVGEIKMYFNEYDRELLSDSGKIVYDRIYSFLYTPKTLFPNNYFKAGLGLKIAPELCYKSNDQIDWTYNYYFKNNPLSAEANLGISEYFALGGNFFLGKNKKYSNAPGNFTNIPLGVDQYEFLFPRFAYGSLGVTFDKWGVNVNVGKEGMQIGKTKTGSIIYNNTFETDGYFQLAVYSHDVKYTMDIIEIEKNKFLYWHEFDVRLFKKVKIGIMEGALVNAPFEIRFLNPTMVFHSFAFWKDFSTLTEDHYYNESHCCSYLGITFELNLIKNLRIYGLYAMNEIQLPNEYAFIKDLSYPDSFGGQLGFELKLPSDFGGYWSSCIEGVYCAPFLYVKQAPDWSLYRRRTDNVTWDTVNSWIGSPLGPDNLSINFSFGYDQPGKWSAGFNYLFSLHGENGFNLFDANTWFNNDLGIWTYYPYTKYILAQDASNQHEMNLAVAEGRNMFMTRVIECKHQFSLNVSYNFNSKLKVQSEIVYTFVCNARHISGNFQHGFQGAISIEYNLF